MNATPKIDDASAALSEYTMIADTGGFERMMVELSAAARIAVDIEADSLYHYFDKVCLIQISTEARTFILDPLAVRELQPFGALLASPGTEKVLHAATYDAYCLGRDYGFTFVNMFDTHIAAQLLGYAQLGLGTLLEKLLGVSHSKRRQRDDWSRRPLEAAQLEYAATDTRHLLELRDLLKESLREKRRLSWAEEEFAATAAVEPRERAFDAEGFRRVKGSRELPLRELGILRALYLRRDAWARELDLPPFKVLNDATLVDLAHRPPAAAHELYRRPGISSRIARKYGLDMLRAIEKARQEDPTYLVLPPGRPWRPPSAEARKRIERLRHWRRAKAEELQLHVGVVFPGDLLETLGLLPPADLAALAGIEGMRQWRAGEFGGELLRILHEPAG